ncbi:hypothetical protein SERLA73DRAFT_80198 [Serpula lacrymans var. lacrymans S7.3]|uniref:Uncharacterized protein n=1 Tax=Serpula lacrymans var. lacrymans (strain S7.3) TaxID=936435 RepID=F8QJ14_SERL3|nr:hypothetical protein SERLA73DRAFT_80198 [Serpula lacrymans var. lacrymans S7.3]
MALTATAQSALPSWDETIVPALRKRLEGESRILSKRMSVASISSVDEASRTSYHSATDSSLREHTYSPKHSSDTKKTTAIPKPTPQQSRVTPDGRSETSVNSHRVNGISSSRTPSYKRTRTYSQTYSYETSPPNGHMNGVALPTPESSRPTSPRTSDVKPTRIPVVSRGRTTSTSSHAYSITNRSDSRNGYSPYQPPTPETSPDLWAVEEVESSNISLSATSIPGRQRSGILNEPAPFNPSSLTSSSVSQPYDTLHEDTTLVARPSTDSEERPFEHWYRGDVHRNGGVGELRVGKRLEMLDIANYGHTLRKASKGHVSRANAPLAEAGTRRKRADSISGLGARESFYLDDERAQEAAMVLDESPLTDVEGDEGGDISDSERARDSYSPTLVNSSAFSSSTPMLSNGNGSRSATPTTSRTLTRQDVTPTRIPVARQQSEPLRSATPTHAPRMGSEPPSRPSMSASPSRMKMPSRAPHQSQAMSQVQTQSQTGNQKRRAKSPATPSPTSASKKSKTKAKPPSATARRKAEELNRRSVAEYPAPVGEDMEDAIPSWTQPVKSGNWDEVVLPVVARKKGLDGQYEQADGSPRPKASMTKVFEPAPGTFGYDHSKYRSPQGEDIPMDEFGQRGREIIIQTVEEDIKSRNDVEEENQSPHPKDMRKIVARPPDSPMPFSQYVNPDPNQVISIPAITVTKPSMDLERGYGEDDEDSAGCCKCVIM